jgi:hypothetical protein
MLSSNRKSLITHATRRSTSSSPSPQTPESSSTNTDSSNTVIGPLMDQALVLDIKVQDKVQKKITKDQFSDIIREVATLYSTDQPTALVGLFATLQAGGTNKSKRSNIKITITNIGFQSKDINKIITKHCKDFTPRQFAIYFRNEIFQIAKKHNITGSCYISLKRNYAHLLTETVQDERYWATDFHLENPNCPEYIRDALQKRFNDKFVKNNKTFL